MNQVAKMKQKVASKQIVTVYDFMTEKRDLIAKALPSHITPERMIGIFEMCIKSNSRLAECTQKSLISAIIQTAQLGLIPGNIAHCYYVPFKNKQKDGSYADEVQFILGYRGMIELVNRSGKAVILTAECVYENDTFDVEQGLNPVLRHIPFADVERGKIIGCYCIAKNMVANEKLFVYLKKEDIDKVRDASKAGHSDFSPWSKWYEEMAKKTAVKRICKLLPLSMDIQKGLSTDETIKTDIAPDMTSVKDDTVWPGSGEVEDADFKQEPNPDPKEKDPTKKMLDLELTIEAAIKETTSTDQLNAVVEQWRGTFINGSKDLRESQKKTLREIHQKQLDSFTQGGA